MISLQLFAVLLLVGINAFFAAAEFSLVAVRSSRVRQLVEAGDPRARLVEGLLSDVGRVVSGVQVGITIASLLLGYLGESTLSNILSPLVAAIPRPWAALVAHSVALVLAFGLLTILQVVLGELVPKSLSLARAERVALLIARPFHWFLQTFSWAIDLLDGIAEKIVAALGVVSPHSHTLVRSTEELQVMVQQAHDRGLIPAAEVKFIQSAMELGQIEVREVMVPRPDVHALPADATLEDTMRMFATTQRSRIPVYEGSLDHILGFVHIKDMIWILLDRARTAEERQLLVDDRQLLVNDRQPPVNDREPPVNEREPQVDDRKPVPEFNLRTMLRDVLIVPETKRASELLLEFRARRTGLAMIVDEFGSILGLATLEDILEQMVGEIHDEFDVVERPLTLADGSMIFDGATNVRDLESQYSIALPEDSSYETVGGFILDHLGFIPRGGESFEAHGFRFTVMEMEHRRVSRVKIKSVRPADLPVADQPTPRTSAALANSAEESATPSTGAEKQPRKEIAKARRAASASNVRRDK